MFMYIDLHCYIGLSIHIFLYFLCLSNIYGRLTIEWDIKRLKKKGSQYKTIINGPACPSLLFQEQPTSNLNGNVPLERQSSAALHALCILNSWLIG